MGHFALGLIGGVSIAAPTFIGAGAVHTRAGTFAGSVAIPACQAGDLILIAILQNNAAQITPSGFTSVSGSAAQIASGVHSLSLAYKVADGSETSQSFSSNGNTTVAQAFVFRGVDTSSPIEAAATTSNIAGASSVAYNQITTLGPARLVIQAFGTTYGSGTGGWTGTPDTGWTEIGDTNHYNTTGSVRQALQLDAMAMTSAGQVPAGTHTFSAAASSIGRTAFAIKPAP